MQPTHPGAKSTPQFIEEARRTHGDKFDYTDVVYVNAKTRVRIRCPRHGAFQQMPDTHLKGSGCPSCRYDKMARTRTTSFEQIVARFRRCHGDRYDYTQAHYVDLTHKITIVCPEHGPFDQRPYCHEQGQGCPVCRYERSAAAQRLTLEVMRERFRKVHGERYDYSQVVQVRNCACKVAIVCRQHGVFLQSVAGHLSGKGCPRCRESRGERRVADTLDAMEVIYLRQKRFASCRDQKPLPFDFYVPSSRSLIEYDGSQHFVSSPRFDLATIRKHDAIKNEWARRHGYSLVRIPYHRFRAIPDIVRTALSTL